MRFLLKGPLPYDFLSYHVLIQWTFGPHQEKKSVSFLSLPPDIPSVCSAMQNSLAEMLKVERENHCSLTKTIYNMCFLFFSFGLNVIKSDLPGQLLVR